jgi:hypothetical protein
MHPIYSNPQVSKTPVPYEVMSVGDELMSVVLPHREGRLPVASAKVTTTGEVELMGKDGQIEVMGAPGQPCPESVVKRLRTDHEGLLFVFFGKDGPIGEQMLRAPFYG